MTSDNNCHTQFVVTEYLYGDAMGQDTPEEDKPLLETYDITELGRELIASDYAGTMETTIVATGDTISVEVIYHVTTDGLVDVELA